MHTFDSRKIKPGDTFICLPGGERFKEDALRRGASEIVHMTREEMAVFAHTHFDAPSSSLKVVGITGTNGKTTVAYWTALALEALGQKPYFLGTINSSLTTPESLDTQQLMREHLDRGGTHFVMEVSSHGIHQHRADGIEFDVKCLTNITQDHLDYHGTFEAYRDTKLHFMNNFPGVAVFPESYLDTEITFQTALKADFNFENLKATRAILLELGFSADDIEPVLSTLTPPPGRFEVVSQTSGPLVIVDFAHTPDGLERVVEESKKLSDDRKGRLIVLFGCGGDRDTGKRPKMGKIAYDIADMIVITQDNPRSEDPDGIVEGILEGIKGYSEDKVMIEHDREKAIKMAIQNAQDSDVVVLAGKGHETTQILADGAHNFDDREIARKVLQSRYARLD
jgi:UDP-N-acetylmuramoyl-L-alanyl-D-glutamate--2,6-diaminopimelate ligase